MTEYVPWVLSAWTVLTMWLLSGGRRVGFLFGLASQLLWLVFDAHVHAYGLMPLGLILGVIYVRGYRKWGQFGGTNDE